MFMKRQKVLSFACRSGSGIWMANVYVGVDDKGLMYFVSPKSAKHSRLVEKNPVIAFSFAWFDPADLENRKGIQGQGICRQARGPKEMLVGLTALTKNFPTFRKTITIKWLKDNAWGSRLWVIKPTYLKYWDDELFGDGEAQEFNLT